MRKLISVLIDNYNYARFIGEAINSVISQTYTDWELIIVDDGSSDNSSEIINEYVKKYPNKITAIYKPNGGQASAFNVGFTLAKGDIIAFLDSDDYWCPNKLEVIAKQHEKYEFVSHDKVFSDNSFVQYSLKDMNKRSKYIREYGYIHFYNVSTSQMSLSRNLLSQILPMPEKEFRICADEYIMLYATYLSNPIYLQEKLSIYRIHENNLFVGTDKLSNKNKRNQSYYNTVKLINKSLIQKNLTPIPYVNEWLIKDFLENEEDIFIEQGKNYVLYGTGSGGLKISRHIELCEGNIVYYCDSNSDKWGTFHNKVKVISPQELIEKRSEYEKIIIASGYYVEIAEKLKSIGLEEKEDFYCTDLVFM